MKIHPKYLDLTKMLSISLFIRYFPTINKCVGHDNLPEKSCSKSEQRVWSVNQIFGIVKAPFQGTLFSTHSESPLGRLPEGYKHDADTYARNPLILLGPVDDYETFYGCIKFGRMKKLFWLVFGLSRQQCLYSALYPFIIIRTQREIGSLVQYLVIVLHFYFDNRWEPGRNLLQASWNFVICARRMWMARWNCFRQLWEKSFWFWFLSRWLNHVLLIQLWLNWQFEQHRYR